MEKKGSFSLGVLLTLTSGIGYSLTALMAKFAEDSLHVPSLIFWRYFIGFLICLTWMTLIGHFRRDIHFRNLKLHFLRAFFVLGAQYGFLYYLKSNTLLNALVLINTGPLFIPMIEKLILKNRVGRSSWIGVIVSFIGVILVLQPNREIFSLMSLVGLSSGLCQGASQVVFGINSQTEKSDIGILYLFFLCSVFSLIPYLFSEATFHDTEQVRMGNLSLLLLGIGLFSVVNQLFRAQAYKTSTPSRLSPFLYSSVLLAAFYDWAIFHTVPNLLTSIGTFLVISGGIAKIYLRHKALKKLIPK
ncbi:MAG: DMT family transporter [Simkaniaceae bacterium]|nr:DMT family transporter [Simkaniaceae bacterium]MCF7852232.1 DMT family transporter [Simkaniaceae bacterium]